MEENQNTNSNISSNSEFKITDMIWIIGGFGVILIFLLFNWSHAENTCMKNLKSMSFLTNTEISRSEAKEFCSCVKYKLTPTYFTAFFSSEETIRKKEIEAGRACM